MDTWSIINPPEGSVEIPTVDVGPIKRKFLDIPYASQSPNQKLDIYLPSDGDGPFPTIVFIHGGAFVLGEKRDAQLLQALEGINRGYAVVSVEHRLAFEAQYPYGLFDVKAAIRFLRANAPKFLLDGDRFASFGDSAGAYYAVMAAATQDNPAFEDLSMGNAAYSSRVGAVVSLFGVFDIVTQDREVEQYGIPDPNLPDIDKLLLGAHSSEIEGLMHFTNPIRFVAPDFPPVLILHGTDDNVVPVIQAYLLEEKVRAVCGAERAEMELYNGWGHGGLDLRWNDKPIVEKVFTFLDKRLKAGKRIFM
jgi:acetyl esterase/lipase